MSAEGNDPSKSGGESHEGASMRKGLVTIAVLAVATVVEYVVAVVVSRALAALVVIAIIKGWFILDGFMHVKAMFVREEESGGQFAELGAGEQ